MNNRIARRSTAVSVSVSLALVAAITVVPAAQATQPTVQPAAKTLQTKTATVQQLLDSAAVVKPITIGYRASKFITPAQRAKKDKFGCNLSKQLLIKAATFKPRVAKGCKITGGVWMAKGGTTRITDSRKVVLAPLISFDQAWGLGAYAWTPAQRYAWATNVIAPPRTRASGVTPLQATNQIFLTSDLKDALKIEQVEIDPVMTMWLQWTAPGPEQFAFMLQLISRTEEAEKYLNEWAKYLNSKTPCQRAESGVTALLTNTSGWGLGISTNLRAQIDGMAQHCAQFHPWTLLSNYGLYSALNGIPAIPANTVVPDQGQAGSTSTGLRVYTDYGTPATDPVTPALFGLHAPPDTGSAPQVNYGYLRLWDSAVSWADLNPSKGVYNWTKLKEALASPIAQGREVMYVLGNTPAWAGDGSPSSAPKDMNDVYDFVKALCGQAGGQIDTYEAWNEGNLQTFWTGTQEQLAQVTKQVRRALNDCPNGGNVVAASTGTRAEGAFVTNYDAYLKGLAKLGWPIDGYAVHSYPSASGGPTERLDGVTQFKTMLAVNGAPVKPIYDSEVNYGLAGLQQNHIDIDATTASAYIARTFIDSVRYGIDYVFWFLWTPAYYNKLGVQMNPTTQAENLAWNQTYLWLVGSRMQRCSDASPESDPSTVVTLCQITLANGSNATLAWTNAAGKTAAIDTTGLGNNYQRLNGTSSDIVGNSVTVGYSPIEIRTL